MRSLLCTFVLLALKKLEAVNTRSLQRFGKDLKDLWRRNPQTSLQRSDTTFGSQSPLMKLGGLYRKIIIPHLPYFNALAKAFAIGSCPRPVIKQVAWTSKAFLKYLFKNILCLLRHSANCLQGQRTSYSGSVFSMTWTDPIPLTAAEMHHFRSKCESVGCCSFK